MTDPETTFDRELRPIVFQEVMSVPTTILDGETHEAARHRRFLEEAAAELAADAKIATDTPWQYMQEGKDAFSIVETDGTSILHVSALTNSTAARKLEANIRRVIACVNACQGIPINMLQAAGASAVFARREHDGLVDAMHQISLASQSSMSSKEECGKIARAALAKVKP
jgi:hypothetical protein